MAWDSSRSTLYAATECNYIDRMGNNFDYRRAKIPKPPHSAEEKIEGNDDDDDSENEIDEEDDDDDRAWPKNAFHSESYWGYTFDAGRHQLCTFLVLQIVAHLWFN